ncbi:2-C-methyl-D-erythritol 4-phosphate cytidylyltransferase [Falsarthrobacter nasiphocae]|uniref:Bifunctional enzyme IspD/IspF n=1 Tax=Falsarthrobacter nasiphocae TaxID=189863 RepID=A0AAE3YE83_9MICC|nr:2-C-methyl-D-erythritol 4-phosphate cytidylyltransferase [Falsarthrobacter nasiphocae]MDR6891764.1 2-C-methyl-D-erythritol 4-phosphate cytidylyltransferase/2-C-methyl-D-erythritol 2,4-cyclodiphosphate synthase [Falsarthrobacter nasiphocae]
MTALQPEGAADSAAPSAYPSPDAAAGAGVTVILAAAGQGTRLGAGVPKALAPLRGEPLAVHALRGVGQALPLAQIVVLQPPADPRLREAVESAFGAEAAGRIRWVDGGAERSDSVRAGLAAVETERVLVHDCARALVPPSVFADVLAALGAGADGAIPAVPVVDTVKLVSDDGAHISSTPPRSRLRAVQTPQGFRTEALRLAHSRPGGVEATDDAMLLEALGLDVRLVPGHADGLKVTGPLDVVLAEHILAAREEPAGPSSSIPTPGGPAMVTPQSPQGSQTLLPEPAFPMPRTGVAVDVHGFSDDPRRVLWLACLDWPGERALEGHSDGDVVAHACADALFSASGIGDLGSVFGVDRPDMAGASGERILGEAARLTREAGFVIGNIAVQLVAQGPVFSPRREEAQRRLSEIAGAPVTVSATTTDHLGFLGRKEGVMAVASALVAPAAGQPRPEREPSV